ncbi:MAG: Penicillin-binding protein 4* [Candidatus Heimdallarchaeota archaeon LC_2]|nr:MAG: Penicillin-binding protein 4* [Candidatus Heimdallarchaeota archaeon LC_2]
MTIFLNIIIFSKFDEQIYFQIIGNINRSFMDIDNFRKVFEPEVSKIMADYKVPGMSIFITKDQETIYSRAYGLRQKNQVKPATIDTLYGISSITKAFTCLGILQLHQKKKLNILDPISQYLPISLDFKDDPVTIQQLMSHNSGIPSLHSLVFTQMNQGLYESKIKTYPLGNWDDFYHHLNGAQSEIKFSPGKKYYYWNGGFVLLGQIIEKISGISYEDYIKTNILTPLNMNRSSVTYEKSKTDMDCAVGYNYKSLGSDFDRAPKEFLTGPFISASAGIISSVSELTNFLHLLLNKGEFNGSQILTKELISEMFRPHNENIASKPLEFIANAKQSYGYGLKIYDNYYGYTIITHSGISGVTGGNIAIIPELNLTFSQLYNVSWLPPVLMHTALILLLGKNPIQIMPYYKRRQHYARLSGTYEAYRKIITLKITEKEGMLHLQDDNWQESESFPLIPRNNDSEVMEFYTIYPGGIIDIPFTFHDNGEITFDYERYIMHKA